MFNKIMFVTVGALLCISTSTELYSSNEAKDFNQAEVILVAQNTKDNKADSRRDDKKKYVGEVKNKESTKRYVGDVRNEDNEASKRRGTEKRYVNDKEAEEDFFKKQKDKTFKYDYEDNKVGPGNSNNAKVNWGQEKKNYEFANKEDAKEKKFEILDEKNDHKDRDSSPKLYEDSQ